MRQPLLLIPRHPYDSVYERDGVLDVFLFVEPLRGFRWTAVTEQRRSVDWTYQVKTLLDVYYPKAKKIRLIMDQLNTQRLDSLYAELVNVKGLG